MTGGILMSDRRDVLNAAKAAVRAYARDPSKANAIGVDVAWRRVRAFDGVATWRKAKPAESMRLRRPTAH
jgi:hypothetical protein